MSISGTEAYRAKLQDFCKGDGVDLGYGGDPIVPWAICWDLPRPYTRVGDMPQHIRRDVGEITRVFQPESLSWVYSSHLLEDFSWAQQRLLVQQILGIVKPGGRVILTGPDQQIYLRYCRERREGTNEHHIEPDVCLEKMVEMFEEVSDGALEASWGPDQQVWNFAGHHPRAYSWAMVWRKPGHT